jgi:predicted transcriptional regulator
MHVLNQADFGLILGEVTVNLNNGENIMKSRGRKKTFADELVLVNTLIELEKNKTTPSRYLLLKLKDMGFVKDEDIKKKTAGRPQKEYSLTEMGLNYLKEKVLE